MMTVLLTISLIAIALATLFVADTFIKGTSSVASKIIKFLVLGGFVCGFIYLFGASHFMSFNVKIKSLDSIRAFISKLVIIILFLATLIVIVYFTIRTAVQFKKQYAIKKTEKEQQSLETVVFDINTIPNIFDDNSKTIFRESINTTGGFSFCLEGGAR